VTLANDQAVGNEAHEAPVNEILREQAVRAEQGQALPTLRERERVYTRRARQKIAEFDAIMGQGGIPLQARL
jgi:hypothetical protein